MKRILLSMLVLGLFCTNIIYAWTYVNRVAEEQIAPGELIVYINSDTQFGEGVAAEVRFGDPFEYHNTRDQGTKEFGSFLSGTANWKVTFNSGVLPTSGFIEYQVMGIGNDNNFYSQSGFNWTIDGSLPVELTSFSATTIGSSVKLNWQTATEVNNYGFDIERNTPLNPLSRGEVEGKWEKIGFVNGNGNSNSPKSYSFIDDNVSAGSYSYRLKQIDNDGQFEYSKVIGVSFMKPSEFSLAQNYPNPFNPTTTIQFTLPRAGNVKLTLFNLLGQKIKTLINEYKESGVHTLNFNASDLNSGLYIYKLEANGLVKTRKMTLVK
ncbi:MAG: T9SS type A sorting domain-containing protein [Ignavibacteriales bacterium]|nr:T9SS type A sorting domain-containing protein [Ignavibacteriales bacterium]